MPVMQHVVLVKFKPEVSESEIAGLFTQLEELKNLIPGIRKFCGGPYSSHEERNQGYSHGFIVEFDDAKARDVYLPHPEHERVKAALIPCVESVLAFDFEE